MKKWSKTLLVLVGTGLVVGCGKSTESGAEQAVPNEHTESTSAESPKSSAVFSIADYPVSTQEIGDFPFFTAPKGAKFINNVKPKEFDFMVFVTPDSIFEVEGRTFRAWVHKDRDSQTEISGRYLYKSYDDAITNAGGVKVFEGALSDDRLKRYSEMVTYAGSDGTFTPTGDTQIVTYVIRRNDGDIYIAFEKTPYERTSIQIVQVKGFEQTIQKITAAGIAKDLNADGKAILYITYDVNKSSLTPDGDSIVHQIYLALLQDTKLKIAINGYTDNSGNSTQNKQLSVDRASAVYRALIALGIDSNRLKYNGFGADQPLVPNDSEENKARNRRVELVKWD